MAKVVKKKKKLGGLRGRASSGGSSVESSPLRPVHVEKDPPCMNGCPNGTRIREILTTISKSEKDTSNFEEMTFAAACPADSHR